MSDDSEPCRIHVIPAQPDWEGVFPSWDSNKELSTVNSYYCVPVVAWRIWADEEEEVEPSDVVAVCPHEDEPIAIKRPDGTVSTRDFEFTGVREAFPRLKEIWEHDRRIHEEFLKQRREERLAKQKTAAPWM